MLKTGRRWWLWWPFLACTVWLVMQDPSETADVSAALPSRSPSMREPSQPATPPPLANAGLLALVPRDRVLAVDGTTSHMRRDLFAPRQTVPRKPAAPVPAVADTPAAPPLPFRYAGKQWDGQTWEVYAVSGEQTFVLREGATLDDHYRVERIAPPQATLTYLPLGTTQILLIGDAR